MSSLVPFASAALIERHLPGGRLDEYYDLLRHENQKVNLVSRETTRADFDRMAAECLLPLDHLPVDLRFRRLLDIGSGGGLPLVPLFLTGRIGSGLAAERTVKKARALARICTSLDLPVKVVGRTIEEIAPDSGFDLITLRYVKLTESLASTISSFLAPTGRFVYYSAVSLVLKQFEIARHDFATGPDQPAKSFSIISLKA